MFCYGPEGREARGYRQRLYARALILEDATGERLGILTADLCVISPLLHRLLAERIVQATGIGADRLLLAATHTHSAPSHYFAYKAYNDYGSSVAGYDTLFVEFLVSRMARAILTANEDLQPARLAWGSDLVWGHTRNRSYEAFVLNDPGAILPSPPDTLRLDERRRAVDPEWTMLRVDVYDPERQEYRPAGAFSIFAIHGTGNPSANDLLDADVHAFIQRGLERHVDSLNHRNLDFRPSAVHLVANGTSGDISPDYPETSRCGAPQWQAQRRIAGPRSPPTPEGWCAADADSTNACLAVARTYVEKVGSALADRAIALFDGLEAELRDDVRVRRAFRTVALKGEQAPSELCDEPKLGTAAVAGAPDGLTRNYDWHFLGLFPIGYEAGGSAIKEGKSGCHAPKRYALYPIHELVSGPHGYPEQTQLMVAQVGDRLLGTLPAEVTITAGARMKAAMLEEAKRLDPSVESIALVSLANGYIQYITTAEEYAAQRYEGGATIFGPGSAAAFEHQLREMVTLLPSSADSAQRVDSIVAYHGKSKAIFPRPTAGPAVERITRTFPATVCRGDTLVLRWIDAYPGRLVPADGAVLRIDQGSEAGGWRTVTWDDHPRLEVRALRALGKRGYLWEARWSPDEMRGHYQAVLLARTGLTEVKGPAVPACR
jgi:neutral ceramidase